SRLRQARRQGFSASRAALWLPPAASFFARRGLPFYLVELDAGSGLNLAADLGGPKSFDSSLIAARVGLDPEPLELREPETKLWLAAGSPPEAVEELSRLKAAVEAASRRMDEEAAFIQLARCPLIKAPAFLRRNIPVDDPDVGLLVFNIAASGRLDEAEYARFRCEMAATLSPWGERGLWLEVELLRGQPFATTVQATLRRPSPGGLLELAAVQFDAVADRVSYDAARADRFLA
ncbi:MAG: DUF2332 family protein, partial [Elusimicrobia bacterium]|nr:DUF2332 family protein [Elusimicrobiota bacterium]